MIDFLIFIAIMAVGGIIFGIIGYLTTRPDPIKEEILGYIVGKFLDERYFSVKKISEALQLDRTIVEDKLRELEQAGVVMKTRKGWQLVDPLVFLTKRDYERALRLTRGDNILYGAYQLYKLTMLEGFLLFILILIFSAIVPILVLIYPPVGNFLASIFGVNPFLASLFLAALLILIADAFDNILKYITRERYMVIVAEHAGILFDCYFLDELSGYIRRGRIRDVEIKISRIQYLNNWFGDTPVGDVIVKTVKGGVIKKDKKGNIEKTNEHRFVSIPYPRELFFIIQSIKLGNLQWRKQNAPILAMWKAGTRPVFPTEAAPARRRKR